jgi:hypothetical protein
VRNFESHVQFADLCASVKISNSAEYSVLQALQFQKVSVRRMLPGGAGINHNSPNQSFVKRKFNICTQTPTFEQRTAPYVRVQGLGYSPFDMVSTCHPPVEKDTKIRYGIYKGNISSI